MPDVSTPRDVLHHLLDGITGLVGGDRSQVERLAALYAPTTHVSHPFAPLGDTPLLSREALRAHFGGAPAGARVGFRATAVHVHDTADPEVVVAECDYGSDDSVYRCVFVVRVRDGMIVESRDYIDHLGSARASGRLDGLLEQLRAAASRTQ
jgi:ketosteroid isomerase-like protein